MSRFGIRPAQRIALIVALFFLLASVGRTALIGYWPMDEGSGPTAFDVTTNPNDGAITGALWTTGKLAGGLNFDGTGDWVNCGTDSSLNIGTSNFTYSLWFKGHDSGSWRWILNQNGDGHLGNHVVITTNGNKVRVSMGSWFTDVLAFTPTTTVQDDVWYHLALTRSGTDVKAYLDGVQEGNTGTSSATIGITRPLYIGRGPLATTIFTGTIDDVGVWNNALDARKVAAVAGLGDFAAVDQDSGEIDNVVALSAPGQSATAGGQTWSYTSVLPADSGGATLKQGLHYTGTNGADYIILEDQGSGEFRGVTNSANANLVSHWKFDDGSGQTAADSGAMANHGMLGTTTGSDASDPTWAAGKIGGALQFNGDAGSGPDDWVDCGNDTSLAVAANEDFTYSMWLKGPGVDGWKWLLNHGNTSHDGLFITLQDTLQGGNVRVSMGGWFSNTINDTVVVDDTSWHHLALTRDDDAVTLYWNGILTATGTSNAALGINRHFFIGKGPKTKDGFNGLIDDVGVWHEELSARRIAAIAGLGDFAGVDLADSGIDDVLALSALGESAVVGGLEWFFTSFFPGHPDGTPLLAGMNYTVDSRDYIILEGDDVSGFFGVSTIPEPATAVLLVLGALVYLAIVRGRSRRK